MNLNYKVFCLKKNILLFLMFFSINIYADDVKSIVIENDFVAGKDSHYTNGFYYSWMNDENVYIPFFLDLGSSKKSKSITFSHLMFTPEDIESTEAIEKDLPYAGYASLGYKVFQYNSNFYQEIGINIGLVGPHTYAKELQTDLHKVIGAQIPQGWDNQLGTHLTGGVNLQLGAKTDIFKLGIFELDFALCGTYLYDEFYGETGASGSVRFGSSLRENFQTTGTLYGGFESVLINYNNIKGFYWYILFGSFYHNLNNVYLTEASDYYEIGNIDFISGNILSLSLGYNSFDITIQVKKSYINGFRIDNDISTDEYGSFSISWEF